MAVVSERQPEGVQRFENDSHLFQSFSVSRLNGRSMEYGMPSSDTASEALAGYMLSMYTLFALEKKGVLSKEEVARLVDSAILNLETHQTRAGARRQAAFEGARALLESLRNVATDG